MMGEHPASYDAADWLKASAAQRTDSSHKPIPNRSRASLLSRGGGPRSLHSLEVDVPGELVLSRVAVPEEFVLSRGRRPGIVC